ncbi:MAG: DUF418 domain-containing protein [Actinomycetota bacterium]
MTSIADPSAAPSTSLAAPIDPSRRIEALDIVRGFALFGVLLLNMVDFGGPAASFEPWAVSTGWWDRLVELGIRVGGEAAFYTTFSFLFGLGFALQFQRALDRGERFGWRFASRLTVLAGFGLIHGFLIWSGDILLQYAVAGFFLLLFAKVGPRAALRWAMGLGAFSILLLTTVFALIYLDGVEPATAADIDAEIAFHAGSFTDIAAERLDGWVGTVVETLVGVPWFLSLFLVGLWAVRSGTLADWRNQADRYRSILRVSVPIAIAAKGALAVAIIIGADGVASTFGTVASIAVGGPALGATYVCLLLLALRRVPDGTHVLRHLGPVGRMALTNYLTQSVVAVLLFYGYGLGWYGRFGVGTTIGFTLAIFAAQIVVSRLWLDRFRFGPMEWLWRTLTYRGPLVSDRPMVDAPAAPELSR